LSKETLIEFRLKENRHENDQIKFEGKCT